MKKKLLYVLPIIIFVVIVMVSFIGKDAEKSSSNDNLQTQETEADSQEVNTQVQETESETEFSEEELVDGMISYMDWKQKSWDEIVSLYPNNKSVYTMNQEFNSESTDLTKWFGDYNGEDFQIIPSTEHSSATVRNRREIVYCCTDETDVQKVLNVMLTGLIDTLMVDSEDRPYTVTRYELDETQPVKQINENVWILSGIEGYYSYDGTDMGTMEQVMPYETDVKDEMIRFFAQGSGPTSQYILIKNGDVYRLEKAEEMGFIIEY